MLGLCLSSNPTVPTPKPRPLGFGLYGPKPQTHGPTGPICLTKLEVPETIDPNPKTNLLMTVCLSQISSEKDKCPVTSAALPSFIRNQDSNAPKQIIQVKVIKIHPFYLKHIL